MESADDIDFVIRPRPDLTATEVVPVIAGIPLTRLIDAYERQAGMEPGGHAYGGLIPAFYNFGSLDRHFRGGSTEAFGPATPVLGCECGKWECWPLLARISLTDDTVTWDQFAQPQRPTRDYTGFGPFRFHRTQYDDALADLRLSLT